MTTMPDHDWLRKQKTLARPLLRLAEGRRHGLDFAARNRAESERIALADFKEDARAHLKAVRSRRELARRNDKQRRRLLQTAIHDRRVALKAEGVSVRETANLKQIILTVPDDVEEKAQEDLHEALWSAAALFEGSEAGAMTSFKTSTQRLEDAMELILRIRSIRDWKISSYPSVRRRVRAATPEPPRLTGGDLNERLTEAQRLLEELGKHEPSQRAYWPVLIGPVIFIAAAVYPASKAFDVIPGVLLTLVAAAVLAIALALRTRAKASRPMATDILELDRALLEAEAALERKERRIEKRLQRRHKINARKREEQELAARKTFAKIVKPLVEPLESREQSTIERLTKRLAILDRARKNVPHMADEQLARRIESIRDKHRRQRIKAKDDCRSVLEVIAESFRAEIEPLDRTWEEGWGKVCASVAGLERDTAGSALSWDSFDESSWNPPCDTPRGIRIGELEIPLDLGPDRPRPTASIPIVIPSLESAHLVLAPETPDDRPATLEALNTLMLRFVTSLPPGKLQLTILDPVGRGASFEGFMNLAEQSETLVSYPVWTENESVLPRLIDLHGSLAPGESEPYRLLVVADFPTGFDEPAIDRLIQIIEEGAQSRVFMLIGLDPSTDVDTSFLDRLAVVLTLRDGTFLTDNALPLTLDPPADADQTGRLLYLVARAAADASSATVRAFTGSLLGDPS